MPCSIRDKRAKFGIHNSSRSPDIGQNSDGGISDILISGESLIKENCHISRTSADIDMNLGPVTKFDKRNKTTSKKFDNDVIPENCDLKIVIVISGFLANLEQSGGRIPSRVCKSYIFSNSNLSST